MNKLNEHKKNNVLLTIIRNRERVDKMKKEGREEGSKERRKDRNKEKRKEGREDKISCR